MSYELLIDVVSFAIGVALVWIAKPSASGVPARFLAAPSLVIVYPVLPLVLLIVGISMLIQALF